MIDGSFASKAEVEVPNLLKNRFRGDVGAIGLGYGIEEPKSVRSEGRHGVSNKLEVATAHGQTLYKEEIDVGRSQISVGRWRDRSKMHVYSPTNSLVKRL